MTAKVLCVDDDAHILAAYQRQLRKQFQIETAQGGEQGLALVSCQGPYAVILSDMRMPGMDGIQFLGRVRETAPDTVRMMLTGNTDLQTAMHAVNEGNIFRFLTKPCSPDTLAKTLAAGIAQYRLVTAEKELLEKTLRGSVKVLTEVLELSNPKAFGRASRVKRLVQQLAAQLQVKAPWHLEIAAMLSQIGCVAVPEPVLHKVDSGASLTAEEVHVLGTHPRVGHDLVANIPRLEAVAEAIAYQDQRFDGSGPGGSGKKGADIPLGARILKVGLDFDHLVVHGVPSGRAFVELIGRLGWYDPAILDALAKVLEKESGREIRTVSVKDLTSHMILAENVLTDTGLRLVTKGQEITPPLLERLRLFARNTGIREPIQVFVLRSS
jgi:response regulator RpfG family c-di-GMP phosphodiesterase